MSGPKGYGLGFPHGGTVGAGFILIFWQAGAATVFCDRGLLLSITTNGPGDVTLNFSADSQVVAPSMFMAQLLRGGGGIPSPDAVGLANAAGPGVIATRVVWPNPVDSDLVMLLRMVHPDTELDVLS